MMNLETKAQLSKTTLYTLMMVASLIIVGTVVIILCSGLSINPFRERTSGFLVASFFGLVGIAFVSLSLNIAANLSLLAETKVMESKIDPSRHSLKPWFIGVTAATAAAIFLVAGGTWLSHKKFMNVVRGQAEEVLSENKNSIDGVAAALKSGRLDDLKRIPDILNYLESRRQDLPELEIIYAGEFQGSRALRVFSRYGWNGEQAQKNPPPYFKCEGALDCGYLKTFFDGGKTEVLEQLTDRDSYRIYVPVEQGGTRFVLRFGRTQSYGKLGS